MQIKLSRLLTRAVVGSIFAQSAFGVNGETRHEVDPITGSETWKSSAHQVAFSFTQILPDQLRAFYAGRGFPPGLAEQFATSCVYMVVVRNERTNGAISYETRNWRIVSNAEQRGLRSTESWLGHWREQGLATPQLVAFEWAQFPTTQEYLPGDWNQGMLSVGLSPGQTFDMTITWHDDDNRFEGYLHDVVCAH